MVYENHFTLMFCLIKWSWILYTSRFGISSLKMVTLTGAHLYGLLTLTIIWERRYAIIFLVFGKWTVTFQQMPIHKLLDILKSITKVECLSQTRLDTNKFSLPCCCAVAFCLLGVRTIPSSFERNVDENMLQKLVGPRPNRVKKIQNGRHGNRGKS